MSTEQERNSRMWKELSETRSPAKVEELFSRGRKLLRITVNGIRSRRITFPHLEPASDCCVDCGAKYGEVHIPPCEYERCPECTGQLLSCACAVTALGSEWDEWMNHRDDAYERLFGSSRPKPPDQLVN
jgi:hypothetical protein